MEELINIIKQKEVKNVDTQDEQICEWIENRIDRYDLFENEEIEDDEDALRETIFEALTNVSLDDLEFLNHEVNNCYSIKETLKGGIPLFFNPKTETILSAPIDATPITGIDSMDVVCNADNLRTHDDDDNLLDSNDNIMTGNICAYTYRPCHHDFLSQITDRFVGFPDSFPFRFILNLVGYQDIFPVKYNHNKSIIEFITRDELEFQMNMKTDDSVLEDWVYENYIDVEEY